MYVVCVRVWQILAFFMAAESSEAGTSGDPDSGGKDEFLPGFPTFNDYSKV